MKREELISSKEFWLVRFQQQLYAEVEKYLAQNNLTQTEFADELNVTKGYVSQILNGDFDHKLSKFIELCLAVKKVPYLKLEDIDMVIKNDKQGRLENPLETNHNWVVITIKEAPHIPVTPYLNEKNSNLLETKTSLNLWKNLQPQS